MLFTGVFDNVRYERLPRSEGQCSRDGVAWIMNYEETEKKPIMIEEVDTVTASMVLPKSCCRVKSVSVTADMRDKRVSQAKRTCFGRVTIHEREQSEQECCIVM